MGVFSVVKALVFGSRPETSVVLDGSRRTRVCALEGLSSTLPVVHPGDRLSGAVVLRLPPSLSGETPTLVHAGVHVEFTAYVQRSDAPRHLAAREVFSRRTLVVQGAASPLSGAVVSIPFDLGAAELEWPSYDGTAISLVYALRVTINRPYAQPFVHEQKLWGELRCGNETGLGDAIGQFNAGIGQYGAKASNDVATEDTVMHCSKEHLLMEVGLDEFIHVRLDVQACVARLGDVIAGTVQAVLIRVHVREAWVSLLLVECLVSPGSVPPESILSQTFLIKTQVCDGPLRPSVKIPFALDTSILGDAAPTSANVAGAFSVRYHVALVIVDVHDRKYFRQAEIRLLARSDKEGGHCVAAV